MLILLFWIFLFLLLPLSLYTGLSFIISRKNIFWQVFKYIWLSVLLIISILFISRCLNAKIVLAKKDFYGTYAINRNYFPGADADWQYNHYRLIIREDDSVFFYATNKNKILKVYKGFMFCNETYPSARIRFEMEAPTHHIFSEQPLITRSRWNFMLVFFSPFYHNMYFEKGDFSLSD